MGANVARSTQTVMVTNQSGQSLNVACVSGCAAGAGGATTVTPGTGTWQSSQAGSYTVTPGTGSWPGGVLGSVTVTPGTGTYPVSGALASQSGGALATTSTNTIIGPQSGGAFAFTSTSVVVTAALPSGGNTVGNVNLAAQTGALNVVSTQTISVMPPISQGLPTYSTSSVLASQSGGALAVTSTSTAVSSLPALAAGANTIGSVNLAAQTGALATTSTNTTLGSQTGGAINVVSTSTVVTGSLPAGTNRLGSFRPVDSADADLTAAIGSQVTRPLGVQEQKDAARQVYIASATNVTGVTTEAVISLSTSSAFTAPTNGGAAATSLIVPGGKRLRISAMTAVWRNNTAAGTSGVVRFRAQSSGACTVSSPSLFETGWSSGTVMAASAGYAAPPIVFPDGLEFSGANTFCVSHLETGTAAGLDIHIVGYTY